MLKELQYLASQGLITLRPNSDESLFIANYTPKVQYDKLWTPLLKQCRGLIINTNGELVAVPFPKFFNIEEHAAEEIPNEPFEVYEKMDGSLGILYWDNGIYKIATRGSFNSAQALRATKMLHEKYSEFIGFLHPSCTYLFEIIYPENRIVCNYGDDERLVLLAIRDLKNNGADIDLNLCAFPDRAKRYDGINDLSKIKEFEDDTKEGFVLKFKSGLRVKVKFSEYVRLHKIITQISAKSIWEYLKDNKGLHEILDRVPDEFYDWVKKTKDGLIDQYHAIRTQAWEDFMSKPVTDTRKDFAEYANKCKNPHLLFKFYDNKEISQDIWKLIKPLHEKPFKIEI